MPTRGYILRPRRDKIRIRCVTCDNEDSIIARDKVNFISKQIGRVVFVNTF